MALIEFNRHPSRRELRVFAALLIVFGAGLGWITAGRTGSTALGAGIAVVTAALGAVGLIRPAWLRPVYVGWMIAVSPIGWLVSNVVLALVFFLVVTPLGCLMRLTGRDALRLKFDRQARSYWEPRQPVRDLRRYFRQF